MKNDDQPHNPELAAIFARIAYLMDGTGDKLTDVNAQNMLGEAPLHRVARKGDINDRKILLEAGANPNLPGEYGFTPLHYAAAWGHHEFVSLLLAYGADKEQTNDDGITALQYVVNDTDQRMKDLLR